jgi:hypothetical protein
LEKIAKRTYRRVGYGAADMAEVPDCSAHDASNIARAALAAAPPETSEMEKLRQDLRVSENKREIDGLDLLYAAQSWEEAAGREKAEVARLCKALEPFANAARSFTGAIGPDGIDDGLTVIACIHGRPECEAILSTADFSAAARSAAREEGVDL